MTSRSRLPSQSSLHRSFSVPLFLCLWGAVLLVLSVFPLPFASAQGGGGAPRFRQPPQVHIRGVLVAPEDTQATDSKTLAVHVGGKSWKLRIHEIETLTETGKSGWSLLNDLLPRRLHLIGPEDLLAPLRQETVAGKPLELEGHLYVGEQQLLLSAVTIQDAER
ncbi:MAG: hypothetical protein HYZ50_22990 [Deltaproteobacteria bacterium]|nr:hypothetical protein [Deltaproteobacteria bacterium]